MDLSSIYNSFICYVLLVIIGYSTVAGSSYAYYVITTHASTELRSRFQSTLRAPSNWFFIVVGGKTIFESMMLYRTDYKTLEECLQKISLKYIKFSRIMCAVITLLLSIFFLIGVFNVPEKRLTIQFVVFVVIHLYTLIASWRFGHKLVEMSQDTAPV